MNTPSRKRRRSPRLPLRYDLVCSVALLGVLVAAPIPLFGLIREDSHLLILGLFVVGSLAARASFAALLSSLHRRQLSEMQRSSTTQVWQYSAAEWRRQLQRVAAGRWRQAAAVACGWMICSGSMATVARGAPTWFVLAMVFAVPVLLFAVDAAVIVLLAEQVRLRDCVLLAEQGHYVAGELRTYDNLLDARLRDGELQLAMPLAVRGNMVRVREVVRLLVPEGKLDGARRYVTQLHRHLVRKGRQVPDARAFGDSTAR